MLNKVFLLGRLGKDVEMRFLNSGTHIVSFPLAITRSKKENGTMWVQCKAFDKTADLIQKYCNKGSQVLIEGELVIRKYTNKEGQTQYFTEIVVGRCTFLSKNNSGENEVEVSQQVEEPNYTADDIPF